MEGQSRTALQSEGYVAIHCILLAYEMSCLVLSLGLNGLLILLHLAFLTRTAVGNGTRNLSAYSCLLSSSDGLLNYILSSVTVGSSD